MDPVLGLFVLVYGSMALVGPAVAAHARMTSQAARLRRALARARRTPIAGASGGVAKIAGRVGALSAIESPLSGRACVHWSVTVRRYELVLLHVERTVDFLVRDGSGKALVAAAGARVLQGFDARALRGPFHPLDTRAAALLRLPDASLSPLYDPLRPMTFVETALAEGDEVAVSGAAQWVLDPEPDEANAGGYREPPKRLEMATREGVQVTIGER